MQNAKCKMQNKKFKRLKEKKIGVLMGGTSTEREISLKTGKAIAEALRRKGLKIIKIDVGKDIAEKLLKLRNIYVYVMIDYCYNMIAIAF